jgi:hypothetical protein
MIAARIDRLRRNEKRLLQRAAVIGRIFWEGAVAHLMPEVEDLEPVLDDLLLRDFITRESRSSITGEHAYRFKHVLIRDVAYAGLAKGARADLHQQVADWLHEVAGEELVEIRAYHLDHAATLLEELDGEAPQELAKRAAGALEKAGRRALAQEANQAARRLFVRSSSSSRRSSAASCGWARRLADLPAQAVEMEHVFADATEPATSASRARADRASNALMRDRSSAAAARRAGAILLDDAAPEDRIEGARHPRADRLVARRPRRRRALNTKALGSRERAQGSRGGAVGEPRARRSRGSTWRGMAVARRSSSPTSGNMPSRLGAVPGGSTHCAGSTRLRPNRTGGGLSPSRGPMGARTVNNLRLGRAATRRPACRRAPVPRHDPDPEAARGPGNAVREPAGLARSWSHSKGRRGALHARGPQTVGPTTRSPARRPGWRSGSCGPPGPRRGCRSAAA